jgi:hypothetical protein
VRDQANRTGVGLGEIDIQARDQRGIVVVRAVECDLPADSREGVLIGSFSF